VKAPVTAGVGTATQAMVRAVDLDDQPKRWGEEVGYRIAEDDLAAKRDAELLAREGEVVDADKEFSELCARMRGNGPYELHHPVLRERRVRRG
jgi:hypothetical protein